MQLKTNTVKPTEYDHDVQHPTLSRGQKLVFWQAFISRLVEYEYIDTAQARQRFTDNLEMALAALYSALLNHPDERLLLNDIWECREDRELVIEAVKQFNAESSKLLEYEKAPEPRPWQAGYQSERGSNFRELRG